MAATIVSLLLPIIFVACYPQGVQWMRNNCFSVAPYVSFFEEGHALLEYPENKAIALTAWKEFEYHFSLVQREKADLACAELLQSEELERMKIDRKERRKAKKHNKKEKIIPTEMPDSMSQLPSATKFPSPEVDDEVFSDAADSKKIKRRRKKRKLKKRKDGSENLDEMLIEDQVRVAFSYVPESNGPVESTAEANNDNFETVLTKKQAKERRSRPVLNPADEIDHTDGAFVRTCIDFINEQESDECNTTPHHDTHGSHQSSCSTSPQSASAISKNRSPLPAIKWNPKKCEASPVKPTTAPLSMPAIQPYSGLVQHSGCLTSSAHSTSTTSPKTSSIPSSSFRTTPSLQAIPGAQPVPSHGTHCSSTLNTIPPSASSVPVSTGIPHSWADLLRHKDSELPKISTKAVTSTTAPSVLFTPLKFTVAPICLARDGIQPRHLESAFSESVERREKDGFALSEFLLPEVARKINCDRTSLTSESSSLSDVADSCEQQRGEGNETDLMKVDEAYEGSSEKEFEETNNRDSLPKEAGIKAEESISLVTPSTRHTPSHSLWLTSNTEPLFGDEFPLGKVPLLDPRYTNFLTDIRVPDIKPSPLDDIGFLSNDSDDEIISTDQQTMATKFGSKVTLSNQQYRPMLKQDEALQRNIDVMTALYHYQSALWAQQRNANLRAGLWMPYGFIYRNQQTQQQPTAMSVMANMTASWRKTLHQAHINAVASLSKSNPMPSPENGGSNSIWQDVPHMRRHEGLIWQFQSISKDKLCYKGAIALCSDAKFTLGKSRSKDVIVMLGMVGKLPVAVKRIPLTDYLPIKESLQKLLQPKFHVEHLIRYVAIVDDDQYGYVAQELCDYTAEEYITKLKTENRFDPRIAYRLVWQMLKGIQMLHCRCVMLHRDLKPSNILIDSQGKIKLSDFGIIHATPEGLTVYYENSIGSNCWRPKECSSNGQAWSGSVSMVHYTMLSDIQVAGMLMHYILTGGQHPFGENAFDIEMNIARGWPKWKEINSEANHLIRLMLASEPRDRPDINAVLRHPFFWSDKRRYDFLVAVGNEILEDSYFSPGKQAITEKLNNVTLQILNREWIDTRLMEELQIQRSYKSTVCDLLKFMVNCQAHYNKLSLQSRTALGHIHLYFLNHFPSLFIPVYRIIKASEWTSRSTLKAFF